LIQALLKEIRDDTIVQAALKTEMKTLRENVSMLSNIIRGGDNGGSLLTEVALLKRQTDELEERLGGIQSGLLRQAEQRHADEKARMAMVHEDVKATRVEKRKRLAIYASIVVAIMSVAGTALGLLLK